MPSARTLGSGFPFNTSLEVVRVMIAFRAAIEWRFPPDHRRRFTDCTFGVDEVFRTK